MPTRQAVKTDKAPPPLPVYSQAIICNGMVYCSGQVAMHPETKAMVEGGIADRTTQCFKNLSAVLEEAGSSLENVVKVGVFLTTMDNFAAMNTVYEQFFKDPKPVRKTPLMFDKKTGRQANIINPESHLRSGKRASDADRRGD